MLLICTNSYESHATKNRKASSFNHLLCGKHAVQLKMNKHPKLKKLRGLIKFQKKSLLFIFCSRSKNAIFYFKKLIEKMSTVLVTRKCSNSKRVLIEQKLKVFIFFF